jgi:fumarate reductase (CoM/CoB) subunit A
MSLGSPRRISADVLVIGGGGAGLRAAIAAAEGGAQVLLAVKGLAARSGATAMAGDSIQAVFHPDDSPAAAFEDVRRAGSQLGDENLIQALVTDAPQRVRDLARYGVKLQTNPEGDLVLIPYPGQSYARGVSVTGNGYSMAFNLRRQALKNDAIELLDDCMVTRLFTSQGRMAGALAYGMRAGAAVIIEAPAVVLATGGYQELWRWTDAEPSLTGDGAWLAFQAGADLVDLEMVQHYPSVVCHPPEIVGVAPSYEILLNQEWCGAQMLDGRGELMLSPGQMPIRSELSQIIFTALQEGRGAAHGGVMISLAHSPLSREVIRANYDRLEPGVSRHMRSMGVDILEQPIEVRPFTHYLMGGVRINEWCETSVPGLLAAGEVGGNMNGADRIGGNGLAESQVFGARAGQRAAELAANAAHVTPEVGAVATEISRLEGFLSGHTSHSSTDPLRGVELKRRIKTIMDAHVNGQRDKAGLSAALEALGQLQAEALPRLRAAPAPLCFNIDLQEAIEASMMVELAQWTTAAALERSETRGCHTRIDFPNLSANDPEHTLISPDGENGFRVGRAPVVRLNSETSQMNK